jgi:plasmid replication initiation protein
VLYSNKYNVCCIIKQEIAEMMKNMEIAKYHNDINTLKFGNFNEKELDIFFSILVRVRDKEESKIILDFYDLRDLSESDPKSPQRLINNIVNLSKKLAAISQTLTLPDGRIVVFSLFPNIAIDPNKKNVVVSINQDFGYLIRDLIGNFTIFDLKEMLSLSGSYAKTLFRLLKQWESTQKYEVEFATFKELLGIPSVYKMGNIDQKILNPALEELQKHFKDLKLEKIKRGREIHKLVFTWKKTANKKNNNKNNLIKTKEPIEWEFLDSEKEVKAEKKQELRKQDEEQQEKVIENLKEQKERFEEEQEKLFELFKSSLTDDLEKEIRKYLIESNQTSEIDLECIKKLNKNVYLKTLLNAYKKMINDNK